MTLFDIKPQGNRNKIAVFRLNFSGRLNGVRLDNDVVTTLQIKAPSFCMVFMSAINSPVVCSSKQKLGYLLVTSTLS